MTTALAGRPECRDWERVRRHRVACITTRERDSEIDADARYEKSLLQDNKRTNGYCRCSGSFK